jgi:RsiW-degrading membrane proteinase PrsW (M82 family)
MNYALYIFFSLIPSFIWLLFYLDKDKHPEPIKMILKVFFWGFMAAIPAVLIETGILDFVESLELGEPFFISTIEIFIGVAFIEEFMKYMVVRERPLKTLEFDEPMDAVIYMIVAALGFAAAENVLIFLSLGPGFFLTDALSLVVLRFFGATFLHGLCSGALGCSIAISFRNRRKIIFLAGLFSVTLLHGLYNFSIMELSGPWNVAIPLIVLSGLTIFLIKGFKKLKSLKSISKI